MGTVTVSGSQVLSSAYFNEKYKFTLDNLWRLRNLLVSDTFFSNIDLLFSNPSDYINSVKCYPFDLSIISRIGNLQALKVGRVTADNIIVPPVTFISKRILLGKITASKKYNNFLDYEPFTKIEMYVPYFGFVSLPTNEVIGQEIYVYLAVDFDTGIGTVYIEVEGRVIMTISQKLGIDIPIGASNLNEIVKDNLANALRVVAGVVTLAVGGAVGKTSGALLVAKGVSMAVTSGIDSVMNSTIRYSRGTPTGGTDTLASPTSIYLIITRPNALEIDDYYAHINGLPLGEIKVLSTLRGFTVIEDIHLDGFDTALDDEINEIDTLLKAGVYL